MTEQLVLGRRSVEFTVLGVPVSQGGTKSVPTRTKSGKTFYRKVTEGGQGLESWRQQVATVAMQQAQEHGKFPGAVEVVIEFRFAMPPSRPKWARLLGRLWHEVKPDGDKIQRAVWDSLKAGGLIVDDSRVVKWAGAKLEVTSGWLGARIRVTEMAGREGPVSFAWED